MLLQLYAPAGKDYAFPCAPGRYGTECSFKTNPPAALLTDPQRPEARGILGGGRDRNPVGVERPLQLLQALPAIRPGLRHDVTARDLQDVECEERGHAIASTASLGNMDLRPLAVELRLGHVPRVVEPGGIPEDLAEHRGDERHVCSDIVPGEELLPRVGGPAGEEAPPGRRALRGKPR